MNISKEVIKIVESYDEVEGAYDLILHSYGPNMMIGSIHIQVDDNMKASKIHSLSKRIETKIYEKLGKQYTDVGIAEEHAVAYASGLAKNGAKPVLALMSSFVQRTYDQLSQDLALNNSPATLLIFWGGISSADAISPAIISA